MTDLESILRISQIAAHTSVLGAFPRLVGAIIAEHFGGALVEITLVDRDKGQVVQWSSGDGPSQLSPTFILSRDIGVRGKTYGRISVGARPPISSNAAAIQFLDIVAQQIALFVELRASRSENSRLQSEVDAAKYHLKVGKIVSRAVGIAEQAQRSSRQAALSWLRSESRRMGKPLLDYAQEFVERAVAKRRAAQAALRLRRTA